MVLVVLDDGFGVQAGAWQHAIRVVDASLDSVIVVVLLQTFRLILGDSHLKRALVLSRRLGRLAFQ